MAIKLKRKKNIIKGARTRRLSSDETQVPSARGFKDPDSRSHNVRQVDSPSSEHRGLDEANIQSGRRYRRKYKKTTSSGKGRVPVKKNVVKVKTKAQPIKKWKKGSKERKEAKALSSKRY